MVAVVKRAPRQTRREVGAEATRRVIVEAARDLFLSQGYTSTSVGQIARSAGVAVQTIYNAAGSKLALLSKVIDLEAAGREAPTRVPDLMRARVQEERTLDGVIRVLADWFADVNARMAPLNAVLREAAVLDPTVAGLQRDRAAQRYRNYHGAAAVLADRAGVVGVPQDEVAALIWTLGHPETYRFLVVEEGWPAARYQSWIADTLQARLLLLAAR